MDKYNLLFQTNKLTISIVGNCLSFARIPLYIKLKKRLKLNEELKKKRKSDKCYICGLGPSLKNIDISKLDGDIIAVNRFNLFCRDNGVSVTPTYYCLTDEDFFIGNSIEDFQDIILNYPKTNFLLNGKYFESINNITNDHRNFYYVCLWKGMFGKKSKLDLSRTAPVFINVIGFAIALAMYVGYKEIILLGCDFNSFANIKAIHCYNEENDSRKWTMAFELFCYSFAADMHYELQHYATNHNIHIINATKGSLIDAYERKEDISDKFSK